MKPILNEPDLYSSTILLSVPLDTSIIIVACQITRKIYHPCSVQIEDIPPLFCAGWRYSTHVMCRLKQWCMSFARARWSSPWSEGSRNETYHTLPTHDSHTIRYNSGSSSFLKFFSPSSYYYFCLFTMVTTEDKHGFTKMQKILGQRLKPIAGAIKRLPYWVIPSSSVIKIQITVCLLMVVILPHHSCGGRS